MLTEGEQKRLVFESLVTLKPGFLVRFPCWLELVCVGVRWPFLTVNISRVRSTNPGCDLRGKDSEVSQSPINRPSRFVHTGEHGVGD